LVGAVIGYPVNVWLVAVGLKHGMGSVRALGAGGHSLGAEASRVRATSGEAPMGLMSAMARPETVTVKQVRRGRKPAEHEKMSKMSMKGGATGSQLAAVTLLTLLALGAGWFWPNSPAASEWAEACRACLCPTVRPKTAVSRNSSLEIYATIWVSCPSSTRLDFCEEFQWWTVRSHRNSFLAPPFGASCRAGEKPRSLRRRNNHTRKWAPAIWGHWC
jgi:hypothetical protein